MAGGDKSAAAQVLELAAENSGRMWEIQKRVVYWLGFSRRKIIEQKQEIREKGSGIGIYTSFLGYWKER